MCQSLHPNLTHSNRGQARSYKGLLPDSQTKTAPLRAPFCIQRKAYNWTFTAIDARVALRRAASIDSSRARATPMRR